MLAPPQRPVPAPGSQGADVSSPPVVGVGVGISQPANFGTKRFGDLPHAATDIRQIVPLLADLARRHNQDLRFTTLVGTEATKQAIFDAIRSAVAPLPPGGLLVFVLAGHATEVPDVSGDEKILGYCCDQVFPTADWPILDDEMLALWTERPDITIFAIADTCTAESVVAELNFAPTERHMQLFHLAADLLPPRPASPVIRYHEVKEGPTIIQFAASVRGTDAGEVGLGEGRSGRLTDAIIATSQDEKNLSSYRSWFLTIDEQLRRTSVQVPALYVRTNRGKAVIDAHPAFLQAGT